MQSFFCLGGVFFFFFGEHSTSDGALAKQATRWRARQWWTHMQSDVRPHPTPPKPPMPEWHAITSGPAPSQGSLKLLHHLAARWRWEREKEEREPPPPPVLSHPPNPCRHIKYHKIISVISMEICLQIINNLPPFHSFSSVQNLFLWAVCSSLSNRIILSGWSNDRKKYKKKGETDRSAWWAHLGVKKRTCAE